MTKMYSFSHPLNKAKIIMFVHEILYFSKSPEFHVHLFNVDLFPWSLGPILYTGLAEKVETFNL